MDLFSLVGKILPNSRKFGRNLQTRNSIETVWRDTRSRGMSDVQLVVSQEFPDLYESPKPRNFMLCLPNAKFSLERITLHCTPCILKGWSNNLKFPPRKCSMTGQKWNWWGWWSGQGSQLPVRWLDCSSTWSHPGPVTGRKSRLNHMSWFLTSGSSWAPAPLD